MKNRLALALALCASLAAAETRAGKDKADKKPAPPPADAVALVDGNPITAADLEKLGGPRLAALRTQEYNLRRQLLDEAITNRLLEREAAARKVTVDDLVNAEVEPKVVPMTEADVKQFYETNKPRFGPTPEAEALKQIEAHFRQRRFDEAKRTYVAALKERTPVKVLLEPPRVSVVAEGPSKGPANAPVTIVEFSDFQCPYCSRVIPTLKQLEARYGDRLRIVFRDLPLVSIHKDAAKAAEAAECAHEQGKFWEMHDSLFANQATLQVEGLKKRAEDLGLDTAKFAECLDSGRHTANWQKDTEAAESYGVTSTPAFFVNGRLVTGAQPLEAFAQVIDEELERAGVVPSKPEAPKPGKPAPESPR